MHYFLKFIFGIKLYMFLTLPLSVIRSFSLHTQQRYMSYKSADIYHCWVVQWKTPDDGHRNCPKHVEFYSKNKFEKLVHLVDFIIRIRTIHHFSQQYFILQWRQIWYNTGNLIYIYIVRPCMLILLFAQEKKVPFEVGMDKKREMTCLVNGLVTAKALSQFRQPVLSRVDCNSKEWVSRSEKCWQRQPSWQWFRAVL